MYTSLVEDNEALNRRVGELEARVAELSKALRHPDCHDKYATDAGFCMKGCPACAALAKEGE